MFRRTLTKQFSVKQNSSTAKIGRERGGGRYNLQAGFIYMYMLIVGPVFALGQKYPSSCSQAQQSIEKK